MADGVSALEHFTRRNADGTYPTFERTRPNGVVLEVRSNPLPDGGFVRTFSDITHRREAQETVARLASEDSLTGLANRRLFREQLEKRCQRQHAGASEAEDRGFAILCLDLDWFKDVNDTLGHWIGDALLKAVADRLSSTMRAGNVVARLGGDEFAILLPRTNSPEKTQSLAKRIAELLSQPYELYGHHVQIGASIGIALAPHDGNDPELLLRAADMALYAAKAAGRGTFRFFHKSMAEQLRAKRQLELDLRAAIDNDELELHYQPLLNVETQAITGFEALMRWQHPMKGLVPPSEFIPIAEETGMITFLGSWALRKACAEAVSWPEHIYVAVNVSPMQFRNGNLVAAIAEALDRVRSARRPAGARNHRNDPDAGERDHHSRAETAARDGRPHLDGRLRHRLLLAQLPAQLPAEQDQDRPRIRERPWRHVGKRRHYPVGDRHRPDARDDDDGRRRRDR